MAVRQQFRTVFKNVQKRCYDTAQRRLEEQIPAIVESIHEHAVNYQRGAFGSMTGNWINSFGVALYRDGRLVAVANMNGEEKSPIRTTLIDGDWFKRGTKRFDETYQRVTFEIDGEKYQGSSDQYFADDEVIQWLRHTWTKAKGFSYRIVSIAEYHKDVARRVLLQVSDEMDARGGNIWQFNLG